MDKREGLEMKAIVRDSIRENNDDYYVCEQYEYIGKVIECKKIESYGKPLDFPHWTWKEKDLVFLTDEQVAKIESKPKITKSDLKTGWIVETREGNRYIVLLGADMNGKPTDILANERGRLLLKYYDENLENELYSDEDDIVNIYRSSHDWSFHTSEKVEIP